VSASTYSSRPAPCLAWLPARPAAAILNSITLTKVEYWHKDHLGSLVATTDQAGAVTARYSYDPFGKRRTASGNYDANGALVIDWNSGSNGTDRGYTGHEHLDDVGIIHMNGRLYDTLLGRFLQVDPLIQDPLNLQNFNRYGYCYNNPMTCSDPSGQFSLRDWVGSNWRFSMAPTPKGFFDANRSQPGQQQIDRFIMTHSWANAIGQTAATYFTAVCGGCGGAIWASYYTYVATGSMNDAARAGAISYATTYAFSYVNTYYGNTWNMQRVFVTSMVGGATARLNGGSFESGFKMSFIISALTYANVAMREEEVISSEKNPDNMDNSVGCRGFNGDGKCIAGSRHECRIAIFCDREHSKNYLPCDSQAGGCQGGQRYDGDAAHHLGPIPCGSGTSCQILAEAFGGPHDWLRDHTGFAYNIYGNSNHFTGIRLMLDSIHNYVAIPFAAPIATAGLIGTSVGVLPALINNSSGRH
jgi:RHS repeat-associated protein